jgi:hypothetical protein
LETDKWIKALGMGARGPRLPDHWADIDDGLFCRAVTFGVRPGMKTGHGIVLYASGTGLGLRHWIRNQPSVPAGSTRPRRVNVALDHWRDFVHDGVALELLNVEERDLRRVIKRRSHVRLSDAGFQ